MWVCFDYKYPIFSAKKQDISSIEIKTFQLHFVYVFVYISDFKH